MTTDDAHARPAGAPADELLYDPDVATLTHAERARTLASAIGIGTLSTLAREPAGFPYGSFVTFALDDGDVVLLVSEMAEHTKNLRADDRASLLVAESSKEDPLANGRVTLFGRCRNVGAGAGEGDDRDRAKRAFLAKHPQSSYYVDYKDFSFWRLVVESARYIGGYGRMSWVTGPEWAAAKPDPIAPLAKDILAHMNADHASTMVAYCKAFSKAKDTTAATMTSVDRYGFEMSAVTGKGPRPVRLAFSSPIANADEARREMVALAKKARQIGAG